MKKLILGILVFVFSLSLFVTPVFALGPTCSVSGDYATIQEAVNDAGCTTINVAAGIYDEQVVIGRSLTLQGVGDTTIIQPSAPTTLSTFYTYPAGTFWPGTVMGSVILVENSANVTVKDLKVDGVNVTSLPVGASRVAGILYGESGGTIDNVTVTTMVVNGYATRSYGIDLSAVGTARGVEVKSSDISNWSRNGIQAQGASLTADIHDNTLIGPGDTLVGAAVPNGILFIHGVGGNATNNTITALHTSVTTFRSAGILVYDPVTAGIVIEDNDISDTDDGVNVAHNANDVIVRLNNLHDNLEVGIHLEDGATNNSITKNTITSNAIAGIRFAGAADPGGPSLADDPPGAGNVANRNNISGNAAGVVNYDDTPQIFDAACNWWGAANGPGPVGPGLGDNVSTNVTFLPWLTSSNLNGPCNGGILVGPPTLFSECAGTNWRTFNNPTFTKKSQCRKYVKDHQHSIKGENVIYTANGLKREADMRMTTGENAGYFEYDDAAKGWYNVKVSSVKVDGNLGWFAGRVVKASNPAWVGLWIFAKVEDGTPDKIWGSFTDETTALNNVQAMLDPADGPFTVTKKNIKVQ